MDLTKDLMPTKLYGETKRFPNFHLVRPIVGLLCLDVWFLFDSVEIFVEAVEEESHQLLRVLLLIAGKFRLESTDSDLIKRKFDKKMN